MATLTSELHKLICSLVMSLSWIKLFSCQQISGVQVVLSSVTSCPALDVSLSITELRSGVWASGPTGKWTSVEVSERISQGWTRFFFFLFFGKPQRAWNATIIRLLWPTGVSSSVVSSVSDDWLITEHLIWQITEIRSKTSISSQTKVKHWWCAWPPVVGFPWCLSL